MYSWGANAQGQLGQGFRSELCLTPTLISVHARSLHVDEIVQICGGAGFSLILDANGDVYACGLVAGQHAPGTSSSEFERVFPGDGVGGHFVGISAGWDFAAAVTDLGQVYVWGSNHFGQLGVDGSAYSVIPHPMLVGGGVVAKAVSCGLRHMAIVTSGGRVLTSGSGKDGQLGVPDERQLPASRATFRQIPGLLNVRSVACGQKHTVVLTESNEVYVFGSNKWGQLGFDPKYVPQILAPAKLNGVQGIVGNVYVGWTHSVVLMENGEVFAWGRNSYGQLGAGEGDSCWLANKLRLPPIQRLAIGAEHNLALDVDNNLFSWGWNEHGSCGNGTVLDLQRPTQINSLKGKLYQIGCGTGQSFAITR